MALASAAWIVPAISHVAIRHGISLRVGTISPHVIHKAQTKPFPACMKAFGTDSPSSCATLAIRCMWPSTQSLVALTVPNNCPAQAICSAGRHFVQLSNPLKNPPSGACSNTGFPYVAAFSSSTQAATPAAANPVPESPPAHTVTQDIRPENTPPRVPQPDPHLDFSDATAVFKQRSTPDLLRAYLVLMTCTLQPLVANASGLISASRRLLGDKITFSVIRGTFFAQFCAGEGRQRAASTGAIASCSLV